MLLIGWSLLEGIGAALIMPTIVALVAGNVAVEARREGVWADRRGRRHRRGGRPADWRLLHNIFLVAMGLRR